MEKKFTLCVKGLAYTLATFIALFSISASVNAQIGCPNETVYFLENFGSGTTASSNPDVLTTGLTYQATGPLTGEGVYRVINNTQQKPEWQNSPDHTGNLNGDMLVINGQAETFYRHSVGLAEGFFQAGNYPISLYLMNVDTLGLCGANALLTKIQFIVEYHIQGGSTWTAFDNSGYTADPVPQTPSSSPKWVQLGSTFVIPTTVVGNIDSIRVTLSDGIVGGCGNDFALDDLQIGFCPSGGPTPVLFLGVSARQSGSGVSVQWSTAQEINSSSFDVERSADGNTNWSTIASVNAAGNSSTVKNYSAYDASPLDGSNFYRIKQYDIDGNFTYSKTVMVTMSGSQTSVSVLANPFHNSLTVNFTSATNQLVNARLVDITGKQIAAENWVISAGTSTKDFSNISGLQAGIYILNVMGANGQVLYNNKVIKQ